MEAKNVFEKDLAKLKNNSVFGKTCEDVRKHTDIRIVTDTEKAQKLFNSYRYKRVKQYGENMIGVEMRKTEVILNKPRYIGAAVLNISKTVMYDFAYDYYLLKFPGSQLLFTDTDSLCFWTPYEGDIYQGNIPLIVLHVFKLLLKLLKIPTGLISLIIQNQTLPHYLVDSMTSVITIQNLKN